jgi:hypothetical protein
MGDLNRLQTSQIVKIGDADSVAIVTEGIPGASDPALAVRECRQGQTNMAGSVPVTMASDQPAIPSANYGYDGSTPWYPIGYNGTAYGSLNSYVTNTVQSNVVNFPGTYAVTQGGAFDVSVSGGLNVNNFPSGFNVNNAVGVTQGGAFDVTVNSGLAVTNTVPVTGALGSYTYGWDGGSWQPINVNGGGSYSLNSTITNTVPVTGTVTVTGTVESTGTVTVTGDVSVSSGVNVNNTITVQLQAYDYANTTWRNVACDADGKIITVTV